MALRGASTTTEQQEWIDFKELAAEGAACVFTVRELEPEKDFGNGPVEPVIADVIVLTGKNAGQFHARERILAKGIRIKLTTVGDSIVGRIRLYGSGARKHPGLEAEEPGDLALAERALAKIAKTYGGAADSNGNGKVPTQRKDEVINEGDDSDIPF